MLNWTLLCSIFCMSLLSPFTFIFCLLCVAISYQLGLAKGLQFCGLGELKGEKTKARWVTSTSMKLGVSWNSFTPKIHVQNTCSVVGQEIKQWMQPKAMAFMSVHFSGEREKVPRNTHHETNATSGGSKSYTSSEWTREWAVMVAGGEGRSLRRLGEGKIPLPHRWIFTWPLISGASLSASGFFFTYNFRFLRAEVMSETKASAWYTDNLRTEAECQGSEPAGLRVLLLLHHPRWENLGSFPIQGHSWWEFWSPPFLHPLSWTHAYTANPAGKRDSVCLMASSPLSLLAG